MESDLFAQIGSALVEMKYETVRSEGAPMLHRRGAFVHRMPDGAYYVSPKRVEHFPVWMNSGALP